MGKIWKIGLPIFAATSMLLAAYFRWHGLTHHGDGVWLGWGGREDVYGRSIPGIHFGSVQEIEYKRLCYSTSSLLFLDGVLIALLALGRWKKPSGNPN